MNQAEPLPYGNIRSVEELGRIVRAHRKAQSSTQGEFAAVCGVGVRFISNLENGKPTMEMGKVLQVVQCLGLELVIGPRGWVQPTRANLSGGTTSGKKQQQ